MPKFATGQKVRIRTPTDNGFAIEVLRWFKEVGIEDPIGIVILSINTWGGNHNVFVDWGRKLGRFHIGDALPSHLRIPKPTGYWIYENYLELAYEPYNPDQEEEDDCL